MVSLAPTYLLSGERKKIKSPCIREKISLFTQGPFWLSSHPSIKGYFVFLRLYSFVELKFTQVPYFKRISLKNIIPQFKPQVKYNMANSRCFYLFSDGLEAVESDQSRAVHHNQYSMR